MTDAGARAVDTLMRVDPGFQQLVEMVLGPGVDVAEIHEVVFGKASPDSSDTHVRRSLEHRVAQGAAVLGATAGTAATIEAARSPQLKDTVVGRGARKLVPTGVQRRWGEAMAKPGRGKKLAGAALALQATELAGTGVMGHTLHRKEPTSKGLGTDLKVGLRAIRPVEGKGGLSAGRKAFQTSQRAARDAEGEANFVARSTPTQLKAAAEHPPVPGPSRTASGAASVVAPMFATPRRALGTAAVGVGAYKTGKIRANRAAYADPYGKSDSWTAEGTFSKVDSDKHLAFGWASVVSKNGLPVVDRQDDIIEIDEVEKAAYEYVQRSRIGGDMHRRTPEDTPHHVADMVESFVLTPEKIAKMGLPADSPTGWWVGFKIHDEDTWQLVKKGERTGFSIHGRGRRRPVDDVTAYS